MGHDEETHQGHEEDRPGVDTSSDQELRSVETPEGDEARQTEAHAMSDRGPPGDEVTEAIEDRDADPGKGECLAEPERRVEDDSCLLGSDYIPPEDQRIRTVDKPSQAVSFETEVADWLVDASARIRKMRQNYYGLPLPLRLQRVRRDVRAIRRRAPHHLYRHGLEYPPYELDVLLSFVVDAIGIRHIAPSRDTSDHWGYTTPELWRGLHERLTGFVRKYGDDKCSQYIDGQPSKYSALYTELRTIAAQIQWVLYSNTGYKVAVGASDAPGDTSVAVSPRGEADEDPGEPATDDNGGPVAL